MLLVSERTNQSVCLSVCTTTYCSDYSTHSSKWRIQNSQIVFLSSWSKTRQMKFYIFLTVHLRIILVGNQLDAQFLLCYVYLNPLHVSSNYVLILRRTTVLTLRLLMSYIYGAPILDVSRSYTTTHHSR